MRSGTVLEPLVIGLTLSDSLREPKACWDGRFKLARVRSCERPESTRNARVR